MLLFRRQVETFPRLELENLFSKTKGHSSPEHIAEFLPFVGSLFGCDLSLPQCEKDGLQASIRRAGDEELESLYLLLLDGHAIVLPVHNLLRTRGVAKELGDVLVKGPQDLDQAVQGDGRQIPFDLGDETLGQPGPLRQLLLGQIAQLSQVSNSLTDLHRLGEHYKKN